MPIIPITNRGKNPMPVAGRQVLPGETRHFAEHELPPHLRPGAPDMTAPDPDQDPDAALADLAARRVSDISAALADLSDLELTALNALEVGRDKPRQGVLNAIAEEELRRASAKQEENAQNADGGSGEGSGAETRDPHAAEGQTDGA